MPPHQQRTFVTALVLVFALTACASVPATSSAPRSDPRPLCTPANQATCGGDSFADGPPPPHPHPAPDAPPCQGFKACAQSFHDHHYYLANSLEAAGWVVLVLGLHKLRMHFQHSNHHDNRGSGECIVGTAQCPITTPVCQQWYALSPQEQQTFGKPVGCP